ncbi:MAG: site-specific integrase [Elusimicrobiota bacterium]
MGLFKRPNSPYWYYSLQIDGKRVFKSTRESDRKRAKLVHLNSLREFRDRQAYGAPSKITLGKMVDIYMRDHSSRLTPRTHKTNLSLKTRILLSFNPGMKLAALTAHDIERYAAQRTGRVKPATINRELTFLQGLYTKAIRWGYVKTSPLATVKKFKEERKPERFLTAKQKARLLKACPESIRPVVWFALKTGMRMSEITNLEWKNVNLDTRRVFVVNTKAHKTRVIPFSEDSREALKRLPKRNKYVFTQEDGGLWIQQSLWKKFVVARAEAGLPADFTFHDLRHSFARDLLDRGVDVYTVSRLLGHGSLRVTERYLSHDMPGAEAAIRALDQSVVKSVVTDFAGVVK